MVMMKSVSGVMSWPAAVGKSDGKSGQDDGSGIRRVEEHSGAGVTASAGMMDGVKRPEAKLDESTADGTEDRFLKLLVAQMRNQDPMNPMENAEVTSQLAQISTVRGIESLNKSMEGFTATNTQSAVLAAVNLIGKKVLAPGERFEFAGTGKGETRLGFELQGKADRVQIDILDDRGQVVYQHTMSNLDAGNHSLSWDGTDAKGQSLAGGMYRLQVTAVDGKTDVKNSTLVPVTVTGVAQTATGALLELDHAKPVSPADARLVI